ncbi:hypothetical protein MESS2_1680001 [Mesorhizobium metallidurans STM 2683]|uniref:Uncharacterized protein n=3 Tax=Mesorhizobium TaxID=68287 RepID=A0A1R3V4H9_9HYPH|nr:conserved hypothetical protein [Mesorhizobium ventifaucium]CCV05822.1 hypothetical protein MESS2_1680001 [Mesorhizobium metallidurans STM 2683]SIT54777.1 conserved hypothetical protein [Mesorhizobium prunaredense]
MVGQVTETIETATAEIAQLIAGFVILFGTANRQGHANCTPAVGGRRGRTCEDVLMG